MIDRFTAKARESINLAVQARSWATAMWEPSILLIGLLEEGGGVTPGCFPRTVLRREE